MPRTALALALCLLLAPALASEDDHADAHHEEEHSAESAHAHEEEHAGEEHAGEDADSEHVSEGAGVRIVHGWTRATTDDEALVFGEIENVSDSAVTLTGASSAVAESAVLVGFRVEDGELSYAPLPGVPLSPGREMELAPNGLAIRLEGLARPLDEGETVDVTFAFDTGEVVVHVAVESADARQHSHAGHQH